MNTETTGNPGKPGFDEIPDESTNKFKEALADFKRELEEECEKASPDYELCNDHLLALLFCAGIADTPVKKIMCHQCIYDAAHITKNAYARDNLSDHEIKVYASICGYLYRNSTVLEK